MSNVRIRVDLISLTSITVDGKEISASVRAATLHFEKQHIPVMTLELELDTVEIDSPNVEVFIPQLTASALINLGWRPPDETS